MSIPTPTALFVIALMGVFLSGTQLCEATNSTANITQAEVDLLDFALNVDYLMAEFFLFGSTGYGLDKAARNLTLGGPPPHGARAARLDPFTKGIIYQFGLQKVGHLRAIKNLTKGIPRPLIDLSPSTFAGFINKAFGRPLVPPFDPYANPINYLLACYAIPYVGLTGLVGGNSLDKTPAVLKLVAGLLGEDAGQDAVIRALLYKQAALRVRPYRATIAEFTYRISELRNSLGGCGVKDEGLVVSPGRGPEGRSRGNVLSGDEYSLSYGRNPEEVLRIVYGSGNETITGGFFPHGANGTIAKSFLPKK